MSTTEKEEIKSCEEENESLSNVDPSAPITRRGVLMSFVTGKVMEIPDEDLVSYNIKNNYNVIIFMLS